MFFNYFYILYYKVFAESIENLLLKNFFKGYLFVAVFEKSFKFLS
jgi:hypothetical protein